MIEVNPYFAPGERYPSIIGVKADGDEHELAYISKAEAMEREPVVRCRDCMYAVKTWTDLDDIGESYIERRLYRTREEAERRVYEFEASSPDELQYYANVVEFEVVE